MLRRVKGRRELRAPGASERKVVRRVSERGFTRRRKMRGKRKFHCTEKAILRGERSEKERAKRVVNFLDEERLW